MTDWEGREKGASCTDSGCSSPLRATKSDGPCKSEWVAVGRVALHHVPSGARYTFYNGQKIRAADVEADERACEPMVENEDGWTDWLHPLPGYRMQCCDCGLTHDMEFAIGATIDNDGPFNEGEGPDGVVIFRASRVQPRATASPDAREHLHRDGSLVCSGTPSKSIPKSAGKESAP